MKLMICGFGRVGRAFAELLLEKRLLLQDKYGLNASVSAVVDLLGASVELDESQPLPLEELLRSVSGGGQVHQFSLFGQEGLTAVKAIEEGAFDVLIEATPTNIVDGEPGLTHIRTALAKGMHVITAAKGPLVLRFGELKALADQKGVSLKFSAATAAALPTVDVGEFCLAGAEILSIEGILNGTTNYILTRMHREGVDYEEALAAAQALGIAEPDPSLDVEGWDTASKLVIIANHLLGASLTLDYVEVSGITGVSKEMIEEAKAQGFGGAQPSGKVIKLIGRAAREEGRVVASVAPRALGPEHPMASVHGAEKGLTFFTDSMDRVTVTGGKSDPKGAAAAMLKDLINIGRI